MKIIAALKRIKHLDRKVEKTKERIKKWSSFVNDSTDPIDPQFGTTDIRKMRQQIHDWMVEKARLRHRIHATNLQTTAVFKGTTYTLDELLCLQSIVMPADKAAWEIHNRKSKPYTGGPNPAVTVVIQYDPKEKTKQIDAIDDTMLELNELLDNMTMETDIIE